MQYVTKESALSAIAHVGQFNGYGRESEARAMLVSKKFETDDVNDLILMGLARDHYRNTLQELYDALQPDAGEIQKNLAMKDARIALGLGK